MYLQWDESAQKCFMDTPYYRKWCEMPWTRKGYKHCANDTPCLEDWQCGQGDLCVPDSETVRPPPLFFDAHNTNKCYTTKQYCEAFEADYGESQQWFIYNKCKKDEQTQFDKKYDCCLNLGQSIAETFFGKTITRDAKKWFGDPHFPWDSVGSAQTFSEPTSKQSKQFIPNVTVGMDGDTATVSPSELKQQYPDFFDERGNLRAPTDPEQLHVFKKLVFLLEHKDQIKF